MLPSGPRRTKPKIIVLSNENPHWPKADKAFADQMVSMLTDGLCEEGYTVQTLKFFDNLSVLDAFDPHEWLIWNWGEELAGQPWTEADVAAELERRGLAYTGSPPYILRFAQNRMRVKQRLQEAGLPTLLARVFSNPAQAGEWAQYPAIVKGANQHASFGISGESIVHTPEELARRIAYLREQHQDEALVEPFLDSREFQVAVWGNDQPEALPPMEFDFSMFTEMRDRLYTYDWKFDHDSRGYKEINMPCPAPVDRPDWRARLEAVAVGAYQAIGLRDYGRFDMRMLGDEPQILDVNPNPDLDHISVFLAGARSRGMTYGQMVARIAEYAAARMPQ
jgi:D-alanine-D-alanine ligase